MTTSRSTPSTGRKHLHIAAGALRNARGEILVCQRPAHKIYPGEWEFPGGKVEPGEGVEAALARELREELGIAVTAARPLIRLRHEYPELAVDLDTWLVTAWDGTPVSNEHPQSAWVDPDALPRWPLLAADRPIVRALRLPAQCVFTPPTLDEGRFARQLEGLPADVLLRLRLPGLDDAQYRACVERWSVDVQWQHPLILDRNPLDVVALGADGFHARADVLAALQARPVPADKWFGASCHDGADLARARALDADYAVLGPVRATPTHPGAPALGWEEFARLATHAGLPVYAIGGVGPADLPTAWRHGAQGVAGIGAYWRDGGSRGASGDASPASSAGIE